MTYKTTLIVGPNAQLFRDASGQAQKAIFTGHPHLIQGRSKMDADTLIFEIATGGVIADGHSHSEVASAGDEDNSADEEKEKKELLEKQAKNLKNDKDKDDDEDTPASSAKDKAATTAAAAPKTKKPPQPPTHAMAPEMIITDFRPPGIHKGERQIHCQWPCPREDRRHQRPRRQVESGRRDRQ